MVGNTAVFFDKAKECYLFDDLMKFQLFKSMNEMCEEKTEKEFKLQKHNDFGHRELKILIALKKNDNINKHIILNDINQVNGLIAANNYFDSGNHMFV